MKINIAIELLDKNLQGVDLSQPENGNPGIGGSEWLFLMLARYLQIYYDADYRITIFHYSDCLLPNGVRDIRINSESDLLDRLSVSDEQIIVHQITKSNFWYERIAKMEIIDIPWAHCYIKYPEVMFINACSNVKRVVFVGREEYDTYIDDDIIKKSTFIYNMLNVQAAHKVRQSDYSKTVTYLGSLVPAKAFHALAEIWPEVLKRVPDAKLQIMGTGKLYDREAKLGKFGIAQEDYENYFMQFLTDEKGNILPTVKFLGLIGAEKEDYFMDTAVGVVNPLGKDETFCLSAVEMELCGVPIVTVGKYGLLDTISDGESGLLYRNKKEFIDYLVKLLEDKELNTKMGNYAPNFVKSRFDAKRIIKEWDSLFKKVINGEEDKYMKPRGNYGNDLKWVRFVIRVIRFKLGIRFLPSLNKTKYTVRKLLKKC